MAESPALRAGQGWLAAEGFDKPQNHQQFNTRAGNSPCLALRSHERIETTMLLFNSLNKDRTLLFHLYKCFLYFPKQVISFCGLLSM